VLPESPASAAGLKSDDRVVAVDGRPVDGAGVWRELEQRLQPGQEALLEVERGGQKIPLVARGFEPQREALLYYHWQLAFAGGCAAWVVVLVATQPFRRLASLWRPILLILTGLGAGAALLFTDWHSPWGVMLFNRRWSVDDFTYPWVQVSVCLGVAITVVGLGTWEVRGIIQESQKNRP
jgi:hypothetical protein